MGSNIPDRSDESSPPAMQSVLILCTGNSCRSQMAEVIWNRLGNETWTAYSAGSKPAGFVHPLAIEVLQEQGHPADGLSSKSVDEFKDQPIDLVVTVCGNAKQACPLFPGAAETLHWPFEDPADAEGTDQQKIATFRKIRDQIHKKIAAYLTQRKDECL